MSCGLRPQTRGAVCQWLSYLPQDRRRALARGEELPERPSRFYYSARLGLQALLFALLLYTDGVTEATDAQGDFFGMQRLHMTMRADLSAPAQQLCDSLVETLAAYHGATPQANDITLVAVRMH
jgi:hypothetical protein